MARRRAKRTHFLKNAGSAASIALKALSIALAVKRLINVERKFHDVSISAGISNTGTFTNLSNIATGDTNITRNGNSIKAVSLQARWTLTINAAATETVVRAIWFRDNEQDGVDPTQVELLGASADIRSLLDLNSFGRFTILKDQIISLSENGKTVFSGKFYLKMNNHVRYSSTAAADASNRKGALYLFLLSNEATNQPTYICRPRLRFIDN